MSDTGKNIVLKKLESKTLNKRITIHMVKCPDGHILFCVSTKRLVNKKERTIVTTEIAYTVDTFLQLSELGKLIIRADGVISHFSEIEELNHWKNTLYHYDYTQE